METSGHMNFFHPYFGAFFAKKISRTISCDLVKKDFRLGRKCGVKGKQICKWNKFVLYKCALELTPI